MTRQDGAREDGMARTGSADSFRVDSSLASPSHKPLPRMAIVLLAVIIVATAIYALPPREPTWDAAVYWGAGKFLWSAGSAGLWEPLRPPLLPLVLGMLWRAGLPPLAAFLFVGMVSIVAVYFLLVLLGRRLGVRRTWIVALAALSPLLVWSAPRGLTEVPAVALALASLLLFVKDRHFLAGLVAALAFLTKFPMGLVVVALAAAIMFAKRDEQQEHKQQQLTHNWLARELSLVKEVAVLCAGFLVPLAVYLVANLLAYGNPFLPFTEGAMVIAKAGIWLYPEGPFFYLLGAIKENLLLFFALPGVILAVRKRSRAAIAVASAALLLMVYFSVLPHKEVRFLALFLPFLGLLAALCLDAVASWRWYIVLPAVLVLLQLILVGVYWSHYDAPYDVQLHAADSSLRSIEGMVLVSTPRPALEVDARLALAYYPVFDEERVAGIKAMMPSYGALQWSDCDIVCAPGDAGAQCEKAKADVAAVIDGQAQFATVLLTRREGDCVVRYVLR
jgi:hypothetical protein